MNRHPSKGMRRLIAEDLEDRYRRLCCQVQDYLHRYGHRLVHGDGGLAVEEIQRTLGLTADNGSELATLLALPAPEAITAERERVEESMAARRAQCLEDGHELPFESLREAFGLSTLEIGLLTAQLAAQTNASLQRLLRMAWADFTVTQPTVCFLAELLTREDDGLERVVWSLGRNSPLVTYRLLELVPPEGRQGSVPLLQRALVIPDRLVRYLLFGESDGTERGSDAPWTLDAPTDLGAGGAPELELRFAPNVRESVEAALGVLPRNGVRPARLLLTGRPGSGRRSLVRQLAHSEGRPLLVIDLARSLDISADAPGPWSQAERHVAETLREAVLHRALLLVRHAERLGDEGTGDVVRLLNGHTDRLVLTADEPVACMRRNLDGLVEIAVPALPSAEQEARSARRPSEHLWGRG